MREFYLVSYGFFILIFQSHGQISGLYPDQFSSYFFNPATVNPAYIAQDGSSEAVVQSKLRNGIYSDIYSIGASVQKTFHTSKQQWHSGRLLFSNEKEGLYISTPRFYGNYSIRIPISSDLDILAGLSLGLVNPNITIPTRALSRTLTDGAAGLLVRYGKSSLGVSSNHIFNSGYASLNLRRYYTTHFETSSIVNASIVLKAYCIWRYFSDIPSQLNAAVSALLNEKLEAGTGYRYRRGAFLFFSLTIDPASQHPLSLGALYQSSLLDQLPGLGESLELSLIYKY